MEAQNPNWLERQTSLIGNDATDLLKNSAVLVFGVGGVGSFAAEALARCGIGKIVLVDFDTVSVSNINRQLIADTSTVGEKKTSVMKSRIQKINPECNVIEKDTFVTPENASDIILSANADFVVDAIDNVSAKTAIIQVCKENGIKIISSMGTGNKLDPSQFKIADISKTSVCPLAKAVRLALRKLDIKNVPVLYSEELPVRTGERVPASISFVPSCAGLMIAGYIVRTLIGK